MRVPFWFLGAFFVGASVLALAGAGCAGSVVGTGGGPTTTTTTTSGGCAGGACGGSVTTTTTTPPECASGTCVAAPSGWQPVALATGACPSGFGSPNPYLSGVTASPNTCSCTCGGEMVCEASATLVKTQPPCDGPPTEYVIITVSSNCMGGDPAGGFEPYVGYQLTDVAVSVGGCTGTPQATASPPYSAVSVNVCTPTLTCSAGACLSDADAALCVAKAGSVKCLAGFTQRTLLSPGVVDTRTCGACTCGATLGSCMLESVGFFYEGNCTEQPEDPYGSVGLPASMCVPSDEMDFLSNSYQATFSATGSGTCTLTTDSHPTGGVELDPSGILTVCCP